MRYTRVLCGLVLTGGLIVAGAVKGVTPSPSNLETPTAAGVEKEKTLMDHLEYAHKDLEGLHQFLDAHKAEHEDLRKQTYKTLDNTMKALEAEIDAYKKDHPEAAK